VIFHSYVSLPEDNRTYGIFHAHIMGIHLLNINKPSSLVHTKQVGCL
jgi:hypothetical protein